MMLLLSSTLTVGRSYEDALPTWGESRAGFVPLRWDGSLLGTAVTGKTSGICFCDVTSLLSTLTVGRSYEDAPPTWRDSRAGLVPLCWDGSLLGTAATGGTTSGMCSCNVTSLSSTLAMGRPFEDAPPTWGESRAGFVPL